MTDENKYGEILEDGALYFKRTVPGSIDKVWGWIVDGEKRGRWLGGGDNATRAGEVIKFDFQHQNLTPHDDPFPDNYKDLEGGVSFDVTVLLFEPPTRITFSWPAAQGNVSEIDIRLSQDGDNTKLELFQRGKVSAVALTSASAGWHVHLDIMETKLANATPAPFWSTHGKLLDDYRARFKDHLARLKP